MDIDAMVSAAMSMKYANTRELVGYAVVKMAMDNMTETGDALTEAMQAMPEAAPLPGGSIDIYA